MKGLQMESSHNPQQAENEQSPQNLPLLNRVFKLAEPSSGRVLIVEDEQELAEVLEYNLIRNGFEVLLTRDGLEACRIIGQEKPDLILLDLMLPLLDGWEICRMLRSHQDPLVAHIPVIMLSALGSVENRLKGYDLGADLYLPKPYELKEVILKTGQLIKKRREYLSLSKKISALETWHQLQDNWQHALFHELKNQLTIISGLAGHLHKGEGRYPKNIPKYAQHIQNSSNYLETLAMNYLLVREVEKKSGPLRLEPMRLNDLFQELSELFSVQAQQTSCRLTFVCEARQPVNLHPVGLKIILSSLIDNALKYAGSGCRVQVSANGSNRELEIIVTDDGPGIEPKEGQQLFEKFYRGAETKPRIKGSGLGLYMARTLAEAMGGSLGLKDQAEPGCSFVLNFPRAED
jgi:signal transduction histidine kinase